MIEEMLAELKELDKVASKIAKRVWANSPEAKDINGVPLTAINILNQVELLADKIVQDFPGANPVLVGLMDGATPFATLLTSALDRRNYEHDYTTMSVSSYGNKLVSGELTVGALPKVKLYTRTVLVLDDVCDTGKTLLAIKNLFATQYPEVVKLMVLVNKGQIRPEGVDPDYAGFELSDKSFVVGMGLDYLQMLRNKNLIKAAHPDFLPSKEEKILLERRDVLRKEIECYINNQNPERQQIAQSKPELTPKPESTLTAPSLIHSFFGTGEPESKDQIEVTVGSSVTPKLGSSNEETH